MMAFLSSFTQEYRIKALVCSPFDRFIPTSIHITTPCLRTAVISSPLSLD